MLKLLNSTRNASFAALLGAGLFGSAAVTFAPAAAQAQQWNRDWNDRGYRGDWNNGQYRGDWDRDNRGWGDRVGVGIGFYGYPDYYPYYSGYSYDPYAYDYDYDYDNGYEYGPYCSDSYDYDGDCT